MRSLLVLAYLGGVEIQTHDLETEPLLIQLIWFWLLGFWHKSTEIGIFPLIFVWLVPDFISGSQGLFHVFFVVDSVETVGEGVVISVSEVLVIDLELDRTNRQVEIFSQFSQVSYCPSKTVHGWIRCLLVKVAGGCDGQSIAENHVKSLLVNWALTLGFFQLLFAWESHQDLNSKQKVHLGIFYQVQSMAWSCGYVFFIISDYRVPWWYRNWTAGLVWQFQCWLRRQMRRSFYSWLLFLPGCFPECILQGPWWWDGIELSGQGVWQPHMYGVAIEGACRGSYWGAWQSYQWWDINYQVNTSSLFIYKEFYYFCNLWIFVYQVIYTFLLVKSEFI